MTDGTSEIADIAIMQALYLLPDYCTYWPDRGER